MDKNNLPAWAQNQLIPTFIDRVDLCPEGCNSEAYIKLLKEKGGVAMNFDEIYGTLTDENKAVVDAYIAKAKEEAAQMEADKNAEDMKKKDDKIAELEKKCEDASLSEEEQVAKALENADPAIKAIFKSMEAQKKAAEEAVRIAKEKEEEVVLKAKAAELSNLALPEEEVIAVCKSINKLAQEDQDKIYNVLKAVEAQKGLEDQGTSIFKSIGQDGDNTPHGTTENEVAWNAIVDEAKVIAKEKNISTEAATTIVIKEKPEMYKRYLDTLE